MNKILGMNRFLKEPRAQLLCNYKSYSIFKDLRSVIVYEVSSFLLNEFKNNCCYKVQLRTTR